MRRPQLPLPDRVDAIVGKMKREELIALLRKTKGAGDTVGATDYILRSVVRLFIRIGRLTNEDVIPPKVKG